MTVRNFGEMAIVYALKKKLEKDGKLCSREIKKRNTWSHFYKNARGKRVVLYGVGEMFDAFWGLYGEKIEVSYAVDKRKRANDYGVPVYDIEKLRLDQSDVVVIVTVINDIENIFKALENLGVKNLYSFPVMEYHKMSIFWKVFRASKDRNFMWQYKMQYEMKKICNRNEELEKKVVAMEQTIVAMHKRSNDIQRRQTERYLYLLHTNRVLNALIDKTDDLELKKEQMSYFFTDVFKNEYVPNFENPKTYNEKMLVLQLYDNNPLYTRITDKYEFKSYVAEKIGEQYVVPLLGVWEEPEQIDFSTLPGAFVLKSTIGGDSNKVLIIKNKAGIDKEEIMKKLYGWKKKYQNDYYSNFNWPYKNIKQRYIAEELLDVEKLPYYDFKVHCFHGQPHYIHVVNKEPHEVTHFDIHWNPLSFKHGFPLIHYEIPKPSCLKEMLKLSRIMSAGFEYVRVDFYVLKDKLYLGELTLTTMGGLAPFEPKEVDEEWGRLI